MLHNVSRNPSHSAGRSNRLRDWRGAATWRWLSSIAVLLMTALSSTPSAADGGAIYLTSLVPDEIAVNSNGSAYVAISGSGLGHIVGNARVYLDTDTVGDINNWSVWLELHRGAESLSLREYRVGKSYEIGHRPPRVDEPAEIAVPQAAYDQWIVGQCNMMAQDLRSAGQSNTAIFGEDRKVTVSVEVDYTYDLAGSGSGHPFIEGQGALLTIDVICKKWPGMAVPQASNGLSAAPTVNAAQLTIIETSGASGACKLKLSGIIETSSPNMEVRYRYVDGKGHKSEVHTVTTDHSSTGLFYQEYNVPNDPGTEQGRVRIVGVSHAFESAWKAYNMTCVDPGATDFSASLPPTLTLSAGVIPNNSVMIGGQVCPKQVRLAGKIKGNGHFHGYAVFHGTSYLSSPQSYEVEHGDTDWVFAIYDLKWEHDINQLAVPNTDDKPMQQTVKFGFNVNGSDTPGAHVKVKHRPIATVPLKPYKFTCQWPKLTPGVQGGNGGLTGQLPAPPAQQQNGQTLSANPQLATAVLPFSIQSPRGVAHQGVIRLQGVANKKAKFALLWFARKSGAYRSMQVPGLPKAMTGATAKFDLKALSAAAAWRLQVCPQGATGASACEQADFKAPALQN